MDHSKTEGPMSEIERRTFLKKAGLAGAGAGILGAAACGSDGGSQAEPGEGPAVVTGPSVRWSLVTSFPRSLDFLHGAATYVAERVEALSEGRFTIEVFPAGEIVPGLQVMDAVEQQTVQAGFTGGYYYIGKNPALAFDTSVPFGLDSRQNIAWMYEAGGLELLREVYADFGIVQFPCGNTGTQMGGWFRRPVETLQDLQGLRMRIPGIGGEIMNRLGVSVQVLAGGDIYPSLERGAIDATEWVGPYDDLKLGFHEIAPHYYYPGWWEPGLNATLQVSRRSYDQLPATYREMLASACREANLITLARYDAQNPVALETLVNEHDVDVRPFSEEILEAAWDESTAFLEERASNDAAFRRVYESYREFRDLAFPYFAGNERAYANFAFPKLEL